jgi:hypothetical protein
VQGHELEALLGAYKSLANQRIDIIITEFSPTLFATEAHAHLYLNLIGMHGFTIFALQRIDHTYTRRKVALPRDGRDVSSWKAIHDMRKGGEWMDLLCVQTTLLNNFELVT